MQSIKVNFANSAGESLAGILDSPAGPPRAYALFAHCFTCSKNLKAATNISRAMAAAGIAVLRFDFTGLGQVDEFQRDLVLDGELTEQQRQRMLEIADRCPVHKTLHNEIKVRTALVDR